MNNASRSDPGSKPIRSLFLILLGSLVSAIGVWWIARAIDLQRFLSAVQTVDGTWLIAAVSAIVITSFTRAKRWAILLRPLTFRSANLLTALLGGQLLNFALPLRLGDIARAAWLGRAPGSSFARVLGSIVIEKVWDWLTLCALIAVAMLIAPVPDWLNAPARTAGWMAAGVLVMFIAAAALPPSKLTRGLQKIERDLSWLPARWRAWAMNNLRRLLESLIALQNRSAVLGALGWSLATWGLGVAANYAVMRAYGVGSWSAALLLMIVLMVGVALPPSIAAIGLWEGLTILVLGVFNLPIELALSIGIALHLIIFVPSLIMLGLLLLLRTTTTL